MTIDEVKKTLREYSKSYPATERVKAYEQGALSRLKTLSLPVKKSELTQEQRQHLSKEAENLYGMLAYTQRCYDAIKANDIDLFAQSFERVTEYRIAVGIKHQQSKRGKGKKGKEGGLKAVMREIYAQGHTDQSSMVKALKKRADNLDEVIQEVDQDSLELRYIENNTEKTVKFSHLNNILSEIRKK